MKNGNKEAVSCKANVSGGSGKTAAAIRAVCLAAALLLLALGIRDGGFQDVRHKAMFVCHECMGID